MRTYKTETVTREEKVVDVFSCDLCGRASPTSYDWSPHGDCELSTCIELRDTTSATAYPEWTGTVTKADVCPGCFKEKIIPALEAIGLKFRTRDVNDID